MREPSEALEKAADFMLTELLCVIHRDGGQHIDAVGIETAWLEAMQLSSERLARTPEPTNAALRDAVGKLIYAIDVARTFIPEKETAASKLFDTYLLDARQDARAALAGSQPS